MIDEANNVGDPVPSTDPTGDTLYGDANCDGTVDISDAVLIMQNQANPEKYVISKQGLINADCVDNPKGVTPTDALAIQMVEAKGAKIVRFSRLEKGEGLEKKEENFAEEVAKQING